MKYIDSKNWLFLKRGLDDFRNGVPPPATDDIFIKVLLICHMYRTFVTSHLSCVVFICCPFLEHLLEQVFLPCYVISHSMCWQIILI